MYFACEKATGSRNFSCFKFHSSYPLVYFLCTVFISVDEVERVILVDEDFMLYFKRQYSNLKVTGTVTMPRKNATELEKDRSIVVYRLMSGVRYRINFIKGPEMRVCTFEYIFVCILNSCII